MKFRSRVSVILVLFVLALTAPIPFLAPDRHVNLPESAMGYVVLGLTIVIVLALLFSMRYLITESHLEIWLGPFKLWSVKISEITTIKRSYNPLSSPAASFKRLMITSNKMNALISPHDEKEFLRVLKKRNPKIEIEIKDQSAWYRFWDWDI